MTEGKPQVQRLLDLLVYAPAGLVETATEEFDKLAEKGRHRVEGQVHTARLVGQLAVQMGRSQAQRAFESALARVKGAASTPGGGLRSQGSENAGQPEQGVSHDSRRDPLPARGASRREGPVAESPPAAFEQALEPAASNGSDAQGSLAIPGYDSLSASQVVQRLDGLSHEELEDVKRHEADHRHRRTILNRVDQLLSGAVDDQS